MASVEFEYFFTGQSKCLKIPDEVSRTLTLHTSHVNSHFHITWMPLFLYALVPALDILGV